MIVQVDSARPAAEVDSGLRSASFRPESPPRPAPQATQQLAEPPQQSPDPSGSLPRENTRIIFYLSIFEFSLML